MLAAVLWLGNISFNVIDNENHVEVVEDEGKHLPEAKYKRFFQRTDLPMISHHET